jgi:hypothetical protein
MPTRYWVPIAIAILLGTFAVTNRLAWDTKSATYDEPCHLVSAWIQTQDGDFRCDPENMALWKYWAVAGLDSSDVKIDETDPAWNGMLSDLALHDPYSQQMLYRTPGVSADPVINAARWHMLALGLVLGIAVAWAAWRIAGPIAALVAVIAYALDPNFLAHASLVKNDVPIALIFFLLCIALWLAGERLTIWRTLLIGLLAGAAVTTKLNGLLAFPIIALVLIARALMPAPWPMPGDPAGTRLRRIFVAGAVTLVAVVTTYFLIWAVYQFRFHLGGPPSAVADFSPIVKYARYSQAIREHHVKWQVADSQLDEWTKDWQPTPMIRAILWANAHHALPQAWLEGFFFTYFSTSHRRAFFCGQYSLTGWWYYFPAAFIFKTPLTTLIALAAAVGGWLWLRKSARKSPKKSASPALFIPPIFYMLAAIISGFNLGLRNILFIYPFLFVFLGVAAAFLYARAPSIAIAIIAIFTLGLAIETFSAFPDFIPFFNVAAGSSRGGLRLLSDSNLDWGQDLPDLKTWLDAHPDENLCLCYFGAADPRVYGIHYLNLPYSMAPDDLPIPRKLPHPLALAISATALQGMTMTSEEYHTYQQLLAEKKPIAVLGGSIYLYQLQ